MPSIRHQIAPAIFATLIAVAGAAALAACATPAVQECGNSGIFCPQGTHCAAIQGICLPDSNTCGDGKMDPGEQCDDGNTVAGDGCSPTCQIEKCGNGIQDINEECDDGASNGDIHDKCSSVCTLVRCGNSVIEQGEQCDDGNTNDGDGCSHTCQKEFCGNGIVDPGEACDLVPQDLTKCSADCKSTLQCGNGTVDPGEECDVFGKDINTSNCRADCVANRCGDGFVNASKVDPTDPKSPPAEQCDDAPQAASGSHEITPTETQTCNVDCTLPSCGDGKINHAFTPPGATGPEQCDNIQLDATGKPVLDNNGNPISLNSDSAACTAGCQINVCGDKHVLIGVEECDDGNRIDNDGCTNNCKLAKCGDGIVETGVEQCDDGNTADNDGCSHDCKIEFCGDGITNDKTEQCDDKGTSSRCNADCTTAKCGDGILNTQFKPDGVHVEQCDDGNTTPGDGCSATCQLEHCGNGVVDPGEECDGTAGLQPCSASCHQQRCGNGILDPGEQCDDGNTVNTDSCTSACKVAKCGDGITETGVEDCDDGVNNGTASSTCSTTCHTIRCGNGVLEQGEECDDGNAIATDSCVSSSTDPASCKIARCGDGITETGVEQCDDGAQNGKNGHCTTSCTLIHCGNGILDPGEQCDNGAGNGAGQACNGSCQINVCGDGDVLVGTEQCDVGSRDGSGVAHPASNGTCDADCTFPVCGDHTLNTAFTPPGAPGPEQCDNGTSNSNTAACTLDCQSARCGDGFVEANVEQCDQPGASQDCPYSLAAKACQVCGGSCTFVAGIEHFCGDGVADSPNEACDDGNTTCGSCNSDCSRQISAAATGEIFAAAANDYRANGDTFVLGDGTTSITFELTTGTAGTGNTRVAISMGDTNAQVAAKIVSAIGSSGLRISASVSGAFVQLTNQRLGIIGNVGITSTVVTGNFAVSGMQGGLGGDCTTGKACTSNGDCLSNKCTITGTNIVGTCM